MKAYMEHINLTVADLEKATAFLRTAFPDFKVRGGGKNDFGKWSHVGTEEIYVALTERKTIFSGKKNYDKNGFNHVGFVVDDIEGLAERLTSAGYSRSYTRQIQKFRIRDYFVDEEGNEYEFVEYLSEIPGERNDYTE